MSCFPCCRDTTNNVGPGPAAAGVHRNPPAAGGLPAVGAPMPAVATAGVVHQVGVNRLITDGSARPSVVTTVGGVAPTPTASGGGGGSSDASARSPVNAMASPPAQSSRVQPHPSPSATSVSLGVPPLPLPPPSAAAAPAVGPASGGAEPSPRKSAASAAAPGDVVVNVPRTDLSPRRSPRRGQGKSPDHRRWSVKQTPGAAAAAASVADSLVVPGSAASAAIEDNIDGLVFEGEKKRGAAGHLSTLPKGRSKSAERGESAARGKPPASAPLAPQPSPPSPPPMVEQPLSFLVVPAGVVPSSSHSSRSTWPGPKPKPAALPSMPDDPHGVMSPKSRGSASARGAGSGGSGRLSPYRVLPRSPKGAAATIKPGDPPPTDPI